MPQLENGFTQIANELIEQFARIRIPGEAMQVFWVMLRKTYGFHKKADKIALSQIVAATGLKKVAVCKAIKKLIELNLITKKGNNVATEYTINKLFDTWKPLPKKVTLPKKVMSVTQKGNLPLPKKDTTKETITKETITKETTSKNHFDDAFEKFWSIYPKKVEKKSAYKKFIGIMKRGEATEDQIIDGVKSYLKSDTVAKGFIKNPTTWLNGGCWSDEHQKGQSKGSFDVMQLLKEK